MIRYIIYVGEEVWIKQLNSTWSLLFLVISLLSYRRILTEVIMSVLGPPRDTNWIPMGLELFMSGTSHHFPVRR